MMITQIKQYKTRTSLLYVLLPCRSFLGFSSGGFLGATLHQILSLPLRRLVHQGFLQPVKTDYLQLLDCPCLLYCDALILACFLL